MICCASVPVEVRTEEESIIILTAFKQSVEKEYIAGSPAIRRGSTEELDCGVASFHDGCILEGDYG